MGAMGRGLLITLGIAGAIAGMNGAAHAQDQSNPLSVTWKVDAPETIRPLSFSLREDTDLEIHTVPLRMPDSPDPGPSAANGAWDGDARFQDCVADPACANAPGRLGLRFRTDGTGGVKFGALVRFGENLQKPRTSSSNAWRFFAAADAHALTWDFNGNDGESVRLEEDKVLVGDAQIGVARPLMGGDLAFGFIHREVSVEGASRDEQFGGVTFSMAH